MFSWPILRQGSSLPLTRAHQRLRSWLMVPVPMVPRRYCLLIFSNFIAISLIYKCFRVWLRRARLRLGSGFGFAELAFGSVQSFRVVIILRFCFLFIVLRQKAEGGRLKGLFKLSFCLQPSAFVLKKAQALLAEALA